MFDLRARFFGVAALVMSVSSVFSAPSYSGVLAPTGAGRPLANGAPMISKAHGYHCRRVLGWDPVAGYYRWHRHAGICQDPDHCLREHRRCIFVLGKGFNEWNLEDWGFDNGRYTACMIKSKCY